MTFVCRMGDPALTRAGVTFDRARGPPNKTQMRAPKPLKYAAKNLPLTCLTKCAKSEKLRQINEGRARSAPKIYVLRISIVFREKKIILGRSQGPRLSPGPQTFVRFVRWDIRPLPQPWSP